MVDASATYKPTFRDELALVRHLVSVLETRLAGRDARRRAGVQPLDWCHLGVLGPEKGDRTPVDLEVEQPDVDPGSAATAQGPPSPAVLGSGDTQAGTTPQGRQDTDGSDSDDDAPSPAADRVEDRLGTRRPPSSLGFEVLLKPDAQGYVELSVDVSLCIFTKHLPTLKEQASLLEIGAAEGAPLVDVVQRWPIEVKGIKFRLQPNGRRSFDDEGKVQEAVDTALRDAFSQPDAERDWPAGARPKVTKPELLNDATAFSVFVASAAQPVKVEEWSIQGSVEIRTSPRPDGLVRIGCYVRNKSPETPLTERNRALKDQFHSIGDARLSATIVAGDLCPIEILPVPQDYQYDRRVWAVGHNTSVITEADAKGIRTTALAKYEQIRIVTRNSPPACFDDLAKNPFQTLEAIHAAMGEYDKDWRECVIAKNTLGLDDGALAECGKDHQAFADEIRRFAAGIAALRADPKLLTAFKGANRVFSRLAKGYDSWHLFQIVFLVMQLPALAVREGIVSGEFPEGSMLDWSDCLDWGDVLWFRTGGGKTEAYLGLACCAMLYDRLRGKTFGLTAWLRFPLRMLSIQQLQRAMRVVWETEKERQSLLGGEADKSNPFRLGYFVGSNVTPNALSVQVLNKYATEERLETLRVVPDCPACGGKGTVKVMADHKSMQFRHTCADCKSELPLDISDDEVYRHLPTLLVGTIDKMATVGQQPKFGMLWGGAKWRCPVHGYAFGARCTVWDHEIKKRDRIPVTPYDPAPSLHIQDELHLLQEELGAFSGHYETLIRYCEEVLSKKPCKVIAATATIEGFERQVQHLYGVKFARRFPARGYDKFKSFYAEPDIDEQGAVKKARLFVAFKSASMTPADASARVTEILQTEAANLAHNQHLALAFLQDAKTADDVGVLLTYYNTSLNYVGSLARGSRVHQALEDAGDKLRPAGTRDFNVEYTSGRATGAEVAEVVHRIEAPPAWDDPSFLDALVATSMISHGVDLERLNVMTMDGVPEETAEYIQASSRSGRKHVGLVAVVLAEYSIRALSIYHRFVEFHNHLERMVSPVPVNRFAKYAAQRTLPGVTLGLIYGRYAAQRGDPTLNKTHVVVHLLDELGGQALQDMKDAYFLGVGVYDERLEQSLADTLAARFEDVELSIRTSHESNVRDAIRPSPMLSLRDVEAGVGFWPDGDPRLLTYVQRTRE